MPRGLKSGVWEDTEFHNRFIPSTKVCLWQRMRREYLEENGIGFFCWTLNDNNFKTGSLFTCVQWSQRTEMAHAWRLTPVTSIEDPQEAWAPASPRPRRIVFA